MVRSEGAAYADMTVDYERCPLVRMSRELGESKVECVGTACPRGKQSYVKFIVRKEGQPAPPEQVLSLPGVEARYEGDGFYAYRLYAPPCTSCYLPLFAERGLLPLKAVATRGELHVATLVDDMEDFRQLVADLRARDAHPKVNVLTHDSQARTEAHKGHPALDELTPRQRQVIESAFLAGYFRGKDLEAARLAQELGMSESTFYNHLRLGSHKVLQHVLGRTEP